MAVLQFRADPARLQIVLAAAGVVTTILLLSVTWLYVLANQDTLRLLKQQWEESRRVYLNFGLIVKNDSVMIWIANLGSATFMITRVRIRTPNGSFEEFHEHLVVQPGALQFSSVPDHVLETAHVTGDIDVTLYYRGPGDTRGEPRMTYPQAYNVLLAQGIPRNVREGLHELRPVRCPKCKKSDQLFMKTDSLSNEDDAFDRERKMESELEASCPTHVSQWIFQASSR
jgi:hypothetical protein